MNTKYSSIWLYAGFKIVLTPKISNEGGSSDFVSFYHLFMSTHLEGCKLYTKLDVFGAWQLISQIWCISKRERTVALQTPRKVKPTWPLGDQVDSHLFLKALDQSWFSSKQIPTLLFLKVQDQFSSKQIPRRGAMACSPTPAPLAMVEIPPSPLLVQRWGKMMSVARAKMFQGSCLNYKLERYNCFIANIEPGGGMVGSHTTKESRQVFQVKYCLNYVVVCVCVTSLRSAKSVLFWTLRIACVLSPFRRLQKHRGLQSILIDWLWILEKKHLSKKIGSLPSLKSVHLAHYYQL